MTEENPPDGKPHDPEKHPNPPPLLELIHELRTPISGMVGLASLLSDTPLSTEQREYVRTLHASAVSLFEIINNVVACSCDCKRTSNETFRLRHDLERLGERLAARLREMHLEFRFDLDPNIPAQARGDSALLQETLYALVTNAAFSTPECDAVTLSACAGAPDPERMSVSFQINARNGGSAPDLADQLQLGRGSVLLSSETGLALARCMVQALGGELARSETEDHISVAQFSIPLEPAGMLKERSIVQRPSRGEEPSAKSHSLNIMVVEENLVWQRGIARMLELEGCRVITAKHGREALALLEKGDVSMVFTDLHLFPMDGFTIAEEVRKHDRRTGSHTPVIAMAAHLEKSEKERIARAGIEDYLSLPLRRDELREKLNRWR